MRLLDTTTLELKEFFDSDIPEYAILSHRWGQKEVSFKEVRKRTARPGPGLRKIENCCRLAASRGFQWVWIDTCCIDKRSSAELSEAINSMYRWYENSAVCYVYLSDVEILPEELVDAEWLRKVYSWKEQQDLPGRNVFEQDWLEQQVQLKRRFRRSCWFTRGWTLQELLAPKRLTFFDANWNAIGDRQDLAHEIFLSTRIDKNYLTSHVWSKPLARASVATKMSFASRRVTSREEDMAYCLLGLFDVNMPLLYGEGAIKSFQRLQIEIMRHSFDDSLFAWTSHQLVSGMLATEPSYFANSHDVMCYDDKEEDIKPPWSMSNRGLKFPIPDRLPLKGQVHIYLNCYKKGTGTICIQLRLRGKTAVRTRCGTMIEAEYPQLYDSTMYDLDDEHVLTRMVYIGQPNEEGIEYEILLASIEEGRMNPADVVPDAHADARKSLFHLSARVGVNSLASLEMATIKTSGQRLR